MRLCGLGGRLRIEDVLRLVLCQASVVGSRLSHCCGDSTDTVVRSAVAGPYPAMCLRHPGCRSTAVTIRPRDHWVLPALSRRREIVGMSNGLPTTLSQGQISRVAADADVDFGVDGWR